MATASHPTDPPQFAVTATAIADTAVRLAVRGEVDIATAGPFGAALHDLLSRPDLTHVELDFAPLAFFDSRGIAALLTACRAARRRGIALTVTNCQGIVRRALDITGLSPQLAYDGTDAPRTDARVRAAGNRHRSAACVVRRRSR
ncbi:STAS domain-containing protein [Planosporangium thailandense]|uniref:Anti-sigma factor antagonist n=1 Tax=Planosporangium thailandense TaxID=765197 RepID=A0ABX0Y841_9ACTN|nr:STAS domain-containing protein [Planosporangium thailandense]NJC74302.1 STAS domain-containing protein [Planosporangium thailandense]